MNNLARSNSLARVLTTFRVGWVSVATDADLLVTHGLSEVRAGGLL
ncbi:hypothetical protein ACFFUP_13930 [Vibrio ostreicida]|uniref:Uncharacterized protein n=1 Tax=Vibrio ostreicida TaxID=526588 RepID=A0ABT8BVI4_9VIBR|nr:hypothetical protein [Vibrio ostreicida]MDN3611145.1 hypothetical protein [Vibrio ostreicida]MDN3612264.1 hypothetical protein [Vibrio ostreicida]NPD08648.1 hypothetical protein [Vibrio ostreicida]